MLLDTCRGSTNSLGGLSSYSQANTPRRAQETGFVSPEVITELLIRGVSAMHDWF